MPRNKRMFPFPFLILPLIFLAALIVMLLWNAIMPVAIHASTLNYWQALGLFILSKILFGGFRGRPPVGRGPEMWRRGGGWQLREKWKNMSDEERAKFREAMRQRCHKPRQE